MRWSKYGKRVVVEWITQYVDTNLEMHDYYGYMNHYPDLTLKIVSTLIVIQYLFYEEDR